MREWTSTRPPSILESSGPLQCASESMGKLFLLGCFDIYITNSCFPDMGAWTDFDFDRMIIAQTSWGKCFNGKTSVCIPWALSFWPCPQEVLETLWWSWFEMCLFVNFLTFALLKQHSHHHGWISHFPVKGGVLLGQRWCWSAFVRVRQARSYPWSSKLWSLWGSSC